MNGRRWRVQFYADGGGDFNRLYSFAVSDGGNAARLLYRFQWNGYKLRAAFINEPATRSSTRIPAGTLRLLDAYGDTNPHIIEFFKFLTP